MDLVIRKLISALFLPVPITLLLCAIGLLLIFFSESIFWGRFLILLSFLVLLLASTSPVPNLMLQNLESQYTPLKNIPQDIKYIVVLGGGSSGQTDLPANNKLSAASMARLVEGIRLQQKIPGSKLVLSGGGLFGSPTDGETMNQVAAMLGVNKNNIELELTSKNTYEEAVNLKKLLNNKPFILVTSAFHMRRAMALFKKQGMHPIPAPTHFRLRQHHYSVKSYLPNTLNILNTDIAIHEYLGLFWARLKGNA